MNKLTAIRIKYDDGTYSEEIPISTFAEQIIWNNSHNLVDILGEVDLTKGNIQQQLNEKFNIDDISTYVDTQISTDVTAWLNEHVNPVGSAVVVDNSLTTAGAAADAQKTGEYLKAILPEYNENGSGYPPGTYVVHNNLLYQSLQMTAFAPPAPPNSEYWRMVSLNKAISELLGIVAEPYYGGGESYAVGDYCIYNNILYRCTTAIQTSDTFNSNQWEAVDKSLTEMLSEKAEQTEVDQLNERLEIVEHGAGLTDDIKVALLQLASKVAYIDEHGQDYYNALEEALYPPSDLVRISAVYTQSAPVYDTSTIDSLKDDLVVTAHFEDASTQTVTAYTLSGTLIAGTITPITVSYNGKTTTFNVNVSYTMEFSMGTNLTKITGSTNWNSGHGAGIEWFDNGVTRRSYYYDKGVAPVYDGNHQKDSPYYPIPIPPNATSVTVSITPNTQFIGPSFYTYDNGIYTRTYDPGWSQGVVTYTFTAGQYDYMCVASKYNSAGTSYPAEPSALTVAFFE